MKKRILGLDTGTNSLGWAVVDKNTDGSYSLVKKGSLIFQEGVKIEKGIEKSKAAERTEYRASRKHYFRRRLRKIEALKVLVDEKLCPHISEEQLNLWHTKKQYPKNDDFMLWQRATVEENPYVFRYKCLFEQLDLNAERDRYALGRALYHLAQRRGFLSNRLDSNDEETGAVKTAISELDNDIKEANCEYLGEFFYKLYQDFGNKIRIRNRYTDREEHYKKEFYAICEKQNLPENLVKRLERALYFQRPLKSQRHGVGMCTFEPNKQRCATSHYAYEEFRMLSLLNNVKIKGLNDEDFRYLTQEEIAKAEVKFYRKSVKNFDFSDIAEAIAGKKNYACSDQIEEKPFRFNYRSTQSVSNCPTIAQLREIFGTDYRRGIAELYRLNTRKDGSLKTIDEMCDDVWNVLYFFSSKDKLKEFAINNLQLDEEKAEAFSKIKLDRSFASLSLKAIHKILPFLRSGYIYSHAVFLANIPTIIGKKTWEENKDFIEGNISSLIDTYNPKDRHIQGTLEDSIKDFIESNFRVEYKNLDKLYHPSMIEAYPDAKLVNGIYQLGSPRTNAIRNPMAMRALHQVRAVVNALLKDQTIDKNTEVHIEYARELNDSNKRQAISKWNKDREKERENYRKEISEFYKEATGKDIEPNETDILKFQLWKEQNYMCLYTGKMIGITEFVGSNPKYDIEHTVPQSVGGDSTQLNLTLCDSRFNREVKKAQLPSQLSNHKEILARIESWKEKINKLSFQIDRIRTSPSMAKNQKDSIIQKKRLLQIERDYWRGKYERFTMTEVPEGFALRQGMGIGLISKYAGLFLKSLFHNSEHNSNVRVVKGATTAEFRKMWGIQNLYEKKSRDNHVHHCIDAITIACIGVDEYSKMARYYHDQEAYKHGFGKRPIFDKPWSTFTEDIKQIEEDILVVHKTQDNMPKQAKRWVQTSKGKFLSMGDSARGALHKDTFYGAIKRDGKVKYVKRQSLDSLKESDLDKIVDDTVRNIIKDAVAGKDFNTAIKEPIYMNKEKGILIKKVRCYESSVKEPLQIRQQRDLSRKEYKQKFNVQTDENYMMAIYEGEVKGKVKRTTELITMLDAASYFKRSSDLKTLYKIAPEEKNGMKLKTCVRKGTQVIMLQSPNEDISCLDINTLMNRLYYVAEISKDSRIKLRHNQEARPATVVYGEMRSGAFKVESTVCPLLRLSPNDFNFLVENQDFTINILGEISIIK